MINQVWMNFLRDVAKSTIRFIDEVYYPDLMAMQAYYKDWYKIGGGLANKNRSATATSRHMPTICPKRASLCRTAPLSTASSTDSSG